MLDSGQGTAFSSSGNFRLVIESEVLVAQGRSGDTLSNCLRAQEGTSAAAHAIGSVVTHVLTAGSYTQGIADRITTHEGLADPHPGYATDTDLATHAAAADPHPTYETAIEAQALVDTGVSTAEGYADTKDAAHVAAGDPHTGYVKEDALVYNVKDHGVTGDGSTDDTTAILAVIAGAAAGSTIYFPHGTYVSDRWTVDARLRFEGDGKNATIIKAKSGASGPLLNWNNSTLRPGCSIRGMGWDMTNATGIAAVYMHNVRNGVVDDIYVSPAGTVGLQLDLAQGMNVTNVDVFNASQAGFKGTHASSSGNNFENCFFDATTTTGIYGFLFDGGIDWWCIACRAFRAPGAALDLQYGFAWNYTTANLNATGKLIGCSADAISDRTSDSATVAAVYFKNAGNCDVTNSFLGAYTLADLTSNASVKLDNTQNMRFTSNRMGGRGVWLVGTASNTLSFTSNQFLFSGGGGTAMYVLTTTPTNVSEHGSYFDQGSDVVPIASNMTNWTTATKATNRRTALTKAGTPTDSDFAVAPADGTPGVNTTTGEWAFRSGSSTFRTATATHEAAADPHTGYVKESEFTAAGQMLVGTGSGTITAIDERFRGPTATVFYDGTNYSIRDERSASVGTNTGSNLATVFNTFSQSLGTTDSEATGGEIVFSTPSANVMNLTDPLVPGVQQTIRGPGPGLRILATGSNWSTGTLAAPKAMLDLYGTSRMTVEGLYLDCGSVAGTTGILYSKMALGGGGTGDIGGNKANSYIRNNLIQHWSVSGLQIGKSADTGGTAAVWITGNHITDDNASANGIGFASYIGDVHFGELNNVRVSNASGYCVYINRSSVHIKGNSHFVNNSSTNTNGCVVIDTGSPSDIQQAYFDNLSAGPAVRVRGSNGAANRVLIANCWVNAGSLTADNTVSAFVFDGTTNQCSDSQVIGNHGDGTDGTTRLKSIVENIAGSKDPAASQTFIGNVFRWTNTFYTGTRPVNGFGNVLEVTADNFSFMRQPTLLNAGAVSDSNFLQPVDGLSGYDTTNHRFYIRDGGTWRSVEMV